MKKAEADNTNNKGEHGFITNLREPARRPATTINDFADDIALLVNTLEKSQNQLQYTSNRAKEVSLEVNVKFLLEDERHLKIYKDQLDFKNKHF